VDDFAQNKTKEATSGEDDHKPGEDDYEPEEDSQDQEYQPLIKPGKSVLNLNKILKRYYYPVTAKIKSAHRSPPYQLKRASNISLQGSPIPAHKSPFHMKRINIYNFPILAAKQNNTTVYIILNSGATTSLISLDKANALLLRIKPTVQKAV
jgi:hypothetical protein